MEKPINSKIEGLRNDAANQEELMKSLAQIDEEGQLTDDVLDAVSGGRGIVGFPTTAGGPGGPEPFPGDILV